MHGHSLAGYLEMDNYEMRTHRHASSQATPDSQSSGPGGTPTYTGRDHHKVSRHDAQQTTPRAPAMGTRNLDTSTPRTLPFMQAPQPIRTHAPGANSPLQQNASGLTPMAAQLQLGPLASHYNNAGAAYTVHAPQYDAWSPGRGEPGPSNAQVFPQAHAMLRQPMFEEAAKPSQGYALAGSKGVPEIFPNPSEDAIKALPQASDWSNAAAHSGGMPPPGIAAQTAVGSWPIMPGLPVVVGHQQQQYQQQQYQQQQYKQQQYQQQPSSAVVQGYHAQQSAHEHAAPQIPSPRAAPTHSYSLRSKVTGAGTQASTSSSSPVTPQPQQVPTTRTPTIRRGLAPGSALSTLGPLLSGYEKSEILLFKEIWFAGRPGVPKIQGSVHGHDPNFGFDDSRGDYLSVVGDHVAYRYEILGTLGRGSFGQVLRCRDHATGTTIALKIIRNKRRFQRQAQVEAGILATLVERDPDGVTGIVRMLDSFNFRSHLCITFELLDMNLYDHIKGGGFAGCGPWLVRRIARQVLVTLRFLRTLNIVHCDLKPENILLTTRGSSNVKVIDFGSSCYADQRVYTYIQSRFYRAPEVILGVAYGPPIDIWSLACVLAELATGTPLFPGEDEAEQLACITEVLGPPHPALLHGASRAKLFIDPATGAPLPVPPNSRGRIHRPGTKTLEASLGSKADDGLFLDFLKKCLRWDPSIRLTPDEALQHEWLRINQQEYPGGASHNAARPRLHSSAPAPTSTTSAYGPLGAAFSSFLQY